MIIKLRQFDKGLWLASPKDVMPQGTLRRASGVHALSRNSARSRPGSSLLYTGNAHSVFYFAGSWFTCVSTILYRDGTSLITGYDGERLSFVKMPPTAGVKDYLFVAGGAQLKKVDDDGDDTNWGISPPSQGVSVADSGAGGSPDGTYRYRITYQNSVTGSRSNAPSDDDDLKLLLHCDGVDTHTTFTDSSPNNFTLTAIDNAQGDTAQKKFGTASGLFDGTGDYLSLPQTDAAKIFREIADGPFYIDTWIRFADLSDASVIAQHEDASNKWVLRKNDIAYKTYFVFYIDYAGVSLVQHIVKHPSSTYLNINQWYHIALIRGWGGDPSALAITVDGTKWPLNTGQESNDFTWPQLNGIVKIGASHVDELNGWLDEISIYGSARETATFTSPTAAYPSSATVTVATNSVDITGIPESADPQVDTVEIWRTQGNGNILFRATTLSNGISSYTDDIADADLESVELPTDNLVPYSWFDDCAMHNASMFWVTRTQEGERGRLYYSPIGRAEAIEGFIEVTSDDDGCQKLFTWGGMLGVITKKTVYQILGTNPYVAREVSGTPGTTAPQTVIGTPAGIFYEAADGVRKFTGTSSELVAPEAVVRLFRGEAVAGLLSFTGVVAEYARNEYMISDTDQTLAVNVRTGVWRNLGVGCNAIYYEETLDTLGAVILSDLIEFEKEGELLDYDTNIDFEIETPHQRLHGEQDILIRHVFIDADTSSESLTVTLLLDNTTLSLGAISTSSRQVTSFNVMRYGKIIGIRLTGAVDEIIEIFEIDIDVDKVER